MNNEQPIRPEHEDSVFDILRDDPDHSPVAHLNLTPYKILISDDDPEVHRVTQLVLKNIRFENHSLLFYHAYDEVQTKAMLIEHPDAAIIFQDVVMDTNHSGLDMVDFIRTKLMNHKIRIVLRTGNPGDAPEERIVLDYDINDYKLKTELTHQRLLTTVYQALRSFRDLNILEKNKQGLEKIISASSELFRNDNLETFFDSILKNILSFHDDQATLLVRENHPQNGFILLSDHPVRMVIAATGRFSALTGQTIQTSEELLEIDRLVHSLYQDQKLVHSVYRGFVISQPSNNQTLTYIYIEGDLENYDTQLISLFISNYTLALERFYSHQMMTQVQQGVIYNLSNVIESRSKETAYHTVRVSEMCDLFFEALAFDAGKRDLLRIAATMHDIGKIGIADAILLKPGKLTPEEFETMKQHPVIASQILSQSNLELFRYANVIAKHHHEKYDGSGYPDGLAGEDIPIEARVIAIVDVFDALTHARCYKSAWTIDEAIDHIAQQSGRHFDPSLIQIFMERLDRFKLVLSVYPD